MAIIPWDEFEYPDLGSREVFPAIDVYETENKIVAEIRGFRGKPDGLDIFIRKGVLYIKGDSSAKEEKKGKGFWKKKVMEESFERVIQLPAGIDAAAAEGTLSDGIIRVSVPKEKGKEKTDKKIKIMEL